MFRKTICLMFVVILMCVAAPAQTLEAIAVLPADTFSAGPTSGQFIAPANGRTPPFPNAQPVQGFSSVLRESNGDFLVMGDNGFGAKENSPDYVLRAYRISPDFKTRNSGAGSVSVKSSITLHDPDRKITFPIVATFQTYPASAIPVAAEIRQNRLLTGWDFDIESVRRAHDGTLWFGDEFGPFLIHTDADGKVLDTQIPLPGVQSPQNPFLVGTPNLGRSKGFEGMAISGNGKTLYPMLEGSLTTEPDQNKLLISEFDVQSKQFTGKQWWYRMDATTASNAIGDLTAVSDRLFLVIERDNNQGATAAFKKIFLVNFDEVDNQGFLVKRQVADLMNIDDPYKLGSSSGVFTFPFQTIESVIPLSNVTLGVLNDNNYPFSAGRKSGEPDNNEFIIIRLDRPLSAVAR